MKYELGFLDSLRLRPPWNEHVLQEARSILLVPLQMAHRWDPSRHTYMNSCSTVFE